MKKLAFLLLFLLIPFSADALEISLSSSSVALGDVIEVQVEGAQEDRFCYTLTMGNKEVFSGEEVACDKGIVHPRKEGNYTLTVKNGGEEATAGFTVAKNVHVNPQQAAVPETEGSIFTEGRIGTVFMQGDMCTVKVFAPGPWTAHTNDDFILLADPCGRNGDVLSFSVTPTEEDRHGTVFIRCGGDTLPLTVRQVAALQETAEEELSFSQERQFIYVEDQAFFVTELSGEETEIAVSATGEWDAFSDDDFLSFTMTDEGLSLYADENDIPYARQGTVTLRCGSEQAYVFVNQPGVPMGPDVLEAQLSMDTAFLWDGVQADVLTDRDTRQLVISANGWEEIFSAEEWAKETEEGLFFQVDVPVTKTGEQMILFTAENDQGSGKKQKAYVNVLPEPAAFGEYKAVFTKVGSRRDVMLLTTAATESVDLLDAAKQPLATFSRQDAEIAFAGVGEERERYIRWTMTVPEGAEPAFAAIENVRVPVEKRTVLTPADITLHSQTDGWWRDKKYSVSDLETSGCAVFSLSHALQLLGYTGDEIAPERLAKTYAMALMKDGSGTMNSTLVGRAGNDFGFKTRYELYENPNTIRDKAAQGAVFTFSVVSGHIACVADVTEDGEKCLIIDSAPSATFERKKDEPVYYLGEDGQYHVANTPADIPGIQYCIETDSYGCAVYYLDMAYVARRGVRLIQPR